MRAFFLACFAAGLLCLGAVQRNFFARPQLPGPFPAAAAGLARVPRVSLVAPAFGPPVAAAAAEQGAWYLCEN